MKSPNVNETQSVTKVVYAINNASSVVCIFSSRLINTFKRAVKIATKDDIVVRVGSQFVMLCVWMVLEGKPIRKLDRVSIPF